MASRHLPRTRVQPGAGRGEGHSTVATCDAHVMLTPVGMSALETACNQVVGLIDLTPDAAGDAKDRAVPSRPVDALIDALADALRRPPCVVAFSGGRDSSLILAAAVAAARREGLPPPVPITMRFPGDPESEESAWQERVISNIGLDEWIRIEFPDGLDVIGDVAQRGLTEVGPMYPGNAHLMVPMLEHAAGGTIVSGVAGDELFGLWRRRHLADVAAGRERPRLSDAVRLAGAVAPARVRSAVLRRQIENAQLPWLRPAAQAQLDEHAVLQRVYATPRWDHHVRSVERARSLTLVVRDVGRLTATHGVEFRAPMLAPRFTASLAQAGGWRGFGGRAATLRTLFGELLPADVIERRSKAVFSHAFFTDVTRRFAHEWSGEGLDESLVDADALRRTWTAPVVDFRSVLLLQSAWCNDHATARC